MPLVVICVINISTFFLFKKCKERLEEITNPIINSSYNNLTYTILKLTKAIIVLHWINSSYKFLMYALGPLYIYVEDVEFIEPIFYITECLASSVFNLVYTF